MTGKNLPTLKEKSLRPGSEQSDLELQRKLLEDNRDRWSHLLYLATTTAIVGGILMFIAQMIRYAIS